jgi:SAM-dependent methyltransferase
LILDLACGTGRHLIGLSKEGYDVVGLDISLNLLRIAKSRWSGAQLVRGDMRFLPFKPEAFSAAISMDTSFGYLPSEVDDMQSLSELRETVNHGGVFNIDVFNRERLILKYKTNRLIDFKWILLPTLLKPNRFAKWILFRFFSWKEYPSFLLLQKRTVDADVKQLHDLWVIHDKEDGQIRVFSHSVRLYEMNHLQWMLENAGFTVSQVYGDYKGQSFSSNSSRLILIAYSF